MKQLADLKAPAPIVKRLLEKDVQRMCVDWARARGYWARKFSSMTQNSVPDYLFALEEHSTKFYCEFKASYVKPKLIEKYGVTVMSTEAQYEEQLAMQAAGWDGFECNNVEKFKLLVLGYEQRFL